MTERLKKALDYIEAHREEYIELLRELCRQPSLAGTGEGIPEMIELVQEKMRAYGIEPTLIPTDGNPVIYAELKGESPRVYGCYDHYDVQPVDPHRPLGLRPLRGGDTRRRHIRPRRRRQQGRPRDEALRHRRLAQDRRTLPCGVKLIFEGEEEIGSPNLEPFAEAHPELLECDGYVWEGGEKERGGPCEVTMGVKGMLYVHMKVKTAGRDAHSMYAAIAPNPAWRLVQALASMKDAEGNITIDGFYDGIIPPDETALGFLESDPLRPGAHAQVSRRRSPHGREDEARDTREPLLQAHLQHMRPHLRLSGRRQQDRPPQRGEREDRLPPRPRPGPEAHILPRPRALDRHGFTDVELIWDSGESAYRSDLNAPFSKAVVAALERLYDRPVALKVSRIDIRIGTPSATRPASPPGCSARAAPRPISTPPTSTSPATPLSR